MNTKGHEWNRLRLQGLGMERRGFVSGLDIGMSSYRGRCFYKTNPLWMTRRHPHPSPLPSSEEGSGSWDCGWLVLRNEANSREEGNHE